MYQLQLMQQFTL